MGIIKIIRVPFVPRPGRAKYFLKCVANSFSRVDHSSLTTQAATPWVTTTGFEWPSACAGQTGTAWGTRSPLRTCRHTWARGGGWGGECPSPSVQKPIPSPRAKNQGPSKNNSGRKKGKVQFFLKKLSLLWFLHRKLDPYLVLKKLFVSYSCFCKNPSFLL